MENETTNTSTPAATVEPAPARKSYEIARERFAASLPADLQYMAVFVPFSRSRNAAEKQPSLNWSVTLTVRGRSITTDYMQGVGHLPGYVQPRLACEAEGVRKACETGLYSPVGRFGLLKKIPAPGVVDVLSCLLLDAEVINYGSFEEWAGEFGYETDSRKAEETYRACVQHGLQLRAMLGDDLMRKLQEIGREL